MASPIPPPAAAGPQWVQQYSAPVDMGQTKQIFDTVDKDKSGHIEFAELKQALSQIGRPSDDEAVRMMLAMYDKDGDQRLSFDEFASLNSYLAYSTNQFQQQQQQHPQAVQQGDLSVEEAEKAIMQTHGEFLNKFGGQTFLQTVMNHFNAHKGAYIGVGVFIAVMAFIGVMKTLYDQGRLPFQNKTGKTKEGKGKEGKEGKEKKDKKEKEGKEGKDKKDKKEKEGKDKKDKKGKEGKKDKKGKLDLPGNPQDILNAVLQHMPGH